VLIWREFVPAEMANKGCRFDAFGAPRARLFLDSCPPLVCNCQYAGGLYDKQVPKNQQSEAKEKY
jgi:hypothetical protein